MFFQFSPPVKKVEKKVSILDDSEDVAVLSLGPFTPNPKIFFNNVTVGNTAVRKLTIKNPQNHDVQITVRGDFPEEITVNLSWLQHLIQKNSEATLELVWRPLTEGSWFHTLNLNDGKRHHRVIPVAFKAVLAKKNTSSKGKKVKGLPKFKVKSPVRFFSKNKSPIKRTILSNETNLPTITTDPPNHQRMPEAFGKENLENNPNIARLFSPNFERIEMEANSRRNTYTVQSTFTENINISLNSDYVFDDSLEESPSKNRDVIETKLQSVSFMFSPVMPENDNVPLVETFNTSTPYTKQVLICSSVEKNKTYDLLPKSQDNSMKGNISTETYIKGNISTETYVKGNISSSTYIKDSSLNGDIANFEVSPIHQDVARPPPTNFAEPNLYPIERPNHLPLDCIREESWNSENSVSLKRKSNYSYHVTPHKRVTRLSDWPITGGNGRFSKRTTGLSLARDDNRTGVISCTDTKELTIKNPFLLAAVENVDPFMTSTVYFSDDWMDEQQENFKKWLNTLLTPPAEFDLHEEQAVDFTKIWNECKKKKEVRAAPTKEVVSNQYHTSAKLEALRKNALVLYRSGEIREVLVKVAAAVDLNKLSIRQDRDVHLDLSLQSEIMTIFVSYNPLWLRIGLETVYNETIPMRSNSDLTSLSCFLMERFFKSPHLLKKYKSVHSPKYCSEIKKLILKKFFSFVYFLDQAKTKKLIKHDPCLFHKNAQIKESREALLKLARETVSAMGDITKYLKYFGYVVTHKQTYIDEFDYAVTSLGVDLRDGVRLTRVMEIILLKNDLSEKLRVPAISRTQKIHNMEVVFAALANAGFEISEDISPKDIVNGHKEKTLSFLWQIVYKFQAPLMVKSATTIQKWWRSDRILQKRQVLREVFERKSGAVRKIQAWYRNQKLSARLVQFVGLLKAYKEYNRIHRAATKIQSWARMYLVRKKYITVRKSVIKIQEFARRWLQMHSQKRNRAAIKIQSYIRMFIAKRRYQKLKYCVHFVETRYLANKLMKLGREKFETLKYATILIQTVFRANRLCRQVRDEFLDLKVAAIILQQHFRAKIAMRTELTRYRALKNATITIQRRYRAKLAMKRDMMRYQTLQYSVIQIQRLYRAKIAGRIQRNKFLELKRAVSIIQQRYRTTVIMRQQREEFTRLRKATLVIQRRYRAKLEMKRFKALRQATISLQKRYRATIIGRIERHRFTQLKTAVVNIQRRYRATVVMKKQHDEFTTLRNATLAIQRRYRAKLAMRREMLSFKTLRQATVLIQQYYRATVTARIERHRFVQLKKAVVTIQRRHRANIIMRKHREDFTALREAALLIQRRYRAKLAMKREVLSFKTLRQAIVLIQQHYRATVTARIERYRFVQLKKAVVTIQRRLRANIIMKKHRQEFTSLKKATILIQKRYRAKLAMRGDILRFKMLRRAAILIQRRYRARVRGNVERNFFKRLKQVALFIQQRYRSNILMKMQREEYRRFRNAVIVIQTRYRAILLMRREMVYYKTLQRTVIFIQKRYRAKIIGRIERNTFIQIKKSVLLIQQRYRGTFIMRKQREEFVRLKKAAVVIQRRYRALLLMRQERALYRRRREAVLKLQRFFRCHMKTKLRKDAEVKVKAVIIIQKYVRRYLIRKQYAQYLTPEAINERRLQRLQNKAAVKIQAAWRGYKSRLGDNSELSKIRKNSIKANENAVPQNTLGSRCRDAMHLIFSPYPSIYEIIRALEDLEFITRRCKDTCLRLSFELPKILYSTITLTNRSLPDMQACTLSTHILINFWKYPPSRDNCWEPDYVEQLVTVMLHWCDKEEPLFPALCTLFWFFCHTEEYKRVILQSPNFDQKIQRIENLCVRKENMVARSSSKVESLFSVKHNLPMPSLTPDWGLEYKSKPKVFSNSSHALRCLLKLLRS